MYEIPLARSAQHAERIFLNEADINKYFVEVSEREVEPITGMGVPEADMRISVTHPLRATTAEKTKGKKCS